MMTLETQAFIVIFALFALFVIVHVRGQTRPHLHGPGKRYQPPLKPQIKIVCRECRKPSGDFDDGLDYGTRALEPVESVSKAYLDWWFRRKR